MNLVFEFSFLFFLFQNNIINQVILIFPYIDLPLSSGNRGNKNAQLQN